MRDAALMIASLGDDFAPSPAERLVAALRRAVASARRSRLARRHLRHLRRLDARLLDDLGLAPEDLAALEPGMTALVASRRLAEAAARRLAAAHRDERWMRIER
ncbi:hypothetical protein [Pinisolibacter sp.]|uniref:hypothetical protein n=1 Tax=Pinisolibacter sp. TaxID=2172024 RepID=UPI002FDCEF54